MEHNTEVPPPRPSLSDTIRRKSSFSGKLNKLTSTAFGRRRESGVVASSEASSKSHRTSRIPTPSFGSRTSSLFGAMNLSNADVTDSSGAQRQHRDESKDRRSILSSRRSRRHSRLTSGSTSSFFGNSNPGTLYPREFLEHPEAATPGKENKDQGGAGATRSQGLRPPCLLYNPDEVHRGLGPDQAKQREPTSSTHPENSTESTPTTTRSSRSISERLANAPFFKLQSARHSLAAPLPPIPPGYSPRSKDRESSVIKERRLMAPIDPPLPRSTTMNIAPITSFTQVNSYQATPRTPNFMRPTSSSAARKIETSRNFKSPPQPLRITSAGKTDVMGFGQWRSQKRLADAHANSPSRSFTQRLRSGISYGIGPQSLSYGKLKTAREPGQLGQEQLQSQDMAYQSAVAETYENVGLNAAIQAAADPNPLFASTSGIPFDVSARGPPPSRIPRRASSTVAHLQSSLSTSTPPATNSSFNDSSSNKSWRQKPLPATPTDMTDRIAQPRFPPRQTSLQPSSLARSHFSSALIEYDDANEERITPLSHANITNPSPSAQANFNAPAAVNPFADEQEEEEEEEDPTLVSQEEGLIYWAGRFSGMNDHLRNEAHTSPHLPWAHDQIARHKRAIELLQAKCTTRAAEESLARFVAASPGVSAGARAGVVLARRQAAPEPEPEPEPMPEPKKKGGLMGKMKGFGRKKSKE
ncbi:MAG: hypothetical protein LQ346_000905 [Caloplaca aetnensis]|nr:MAG: hypothetical protein LQ346_000905 [Caloplaca aetnensis]